MVSRQNNNSVNLCVLLRMPKRLLYISCVYILVNIFRPLFPSSSSAADEIVLQDLIQTLRRYLHESFLMFLILAMNKNAQLARRPCIYLRAQ